MAVVAALSLGALAWIVDQGIGYPLVKPVCASGETGLLHVVSAAAFLLAVCGCWLGVLAGRVNRYRFLAAVAVGFNLLIGLLVATTSVAPFLLGPCE